MNNDYRWVYSKISFETAVIRFKKKDNNERVMLCTRNTATGKIDFGNLGGLLNGHDKRCNIKNGNLAVIDLTIGECRAFNIDRVISIDWLGEIYTKEELESCFDKLMEIQKESNKNKEDVNFDTL